MKKNKRGSAQKATWMVMLVLAFLISACEKEESKKTNEIEPPVEAESPTTAESAPVTGVISQKPEPIAVRVKFTAPKMLDCIIKAGEPDCVMSEIPYCPSIVVVVVEDEGRYACNVTCGPPRNGQCDCDLDEASCSPIS
jgi:hypothetical protein